MSGNGLATATRDQSFSVIIFEHSCRHSMLLYVMNLCHRQKLARWQVKHCCQSIDVEHVAIFKALVANCKCFRLLMKAHSFDCGCYDLWLYRYVGTVINSAVDWIIRVAGERSSTGLIEWDSKSDALEALVMANHTPLPNPSMWHFLSIDFVNVWMNGQCLVHVL